MKAKAPANDEAPKSAKAAAGDLGISSDSAPEGGGAGDGGESSGDEPAGDGGEEAPEGSGESEAAEEAGDGQGEETPKSSGKISRLMGSVTAVMQDRATLRARIVKLEEENRTLREQLAIAQPLADAHRELAAEVERLEAGQKTLAQGVKSELESIGVKADEAPQAGAGDAGETIAELTQRMEAEKDPAKRRAIYNQIREKEKNG